MLTSKNLKKFAKQSGADLVGIAAMDRFEGAPMQMDPRYIFPDAKAAVVLGFRIPRGCYRGIEEGTYFAALPSIGYSNINLVIAPIVLRKVTLFLEDYGYEAVPIQNMSIGHPIDIGNGESVSESVNGFTSIPVSPDKPAPDVFVHFRLAAVAAGLGEIGYSKVFLSPEFGPRQRLALLLTDAPLEPDPLFEGKICDRCMLCVKDCSGNAISRSETVKANIGGKECEWGKLDELRCSIAYTGGVRATSPFLPPEVDYKVESREFKNNEEANDIVAKMYENMPYWKNSDRIFHHNPSIEGARGCMRACMIHLEKEGRIKAVFKNPFRKRKTWSLS